MKSNIRLLSLALLVTAALVLPRAQRTLLATSCTTDSDCSGTSRACDLTTLTCVSCAPSGDGATDSADCCSGYLNPNTGYCASQSGSCPSCSSDTNCKVQGCSYPACDVTFATCESCVPDGDAPGSPGDCCNLDYDSQSGLCGNGTGSCGSCSQGNDECYTCGEVCDYPEPGGNGNCAGCVPPGDWTLNQFDCCSGIGNYDNGWYQCE